MAPKEIGSAGRGEAGADWKPRAGLASGEMRMGQKSVVAIFGGPAWRDPDLCSLAREVAAEIEDLGYDGLWLSAGQARGRLPSMFGGLLDCTQKMQITVGVVSIWKSTPEQTSQSFAELEERYPDRLLIGLGTSHADHADDYAKPLSRMARYLDELDKTDPGPNPRRRRAENGRVGRQALCRGIPLFRSARSHVTCPLDPRACPRLTPSKRYSRKRAPALPVVSPGHIWIVICDRQTTHRVCGVSDLATRTLSLGAAIVWSTPSWRGGTRTNC